MIERGDGMRGGGGGQQVEGSIEIGDVHLSVNVIVPERVEGGGRHKLGKMRQGDCNDDGCRCHLVALHWDVTLLHVH